MTMIKEEDIISAGGDWAGYGEILGQQLIALMQANKISVVFADKGLVVAVENSSGQVGTYNLQHLANFP